MDEKKDDKEKESEESIFVVDIDEFASQQESSTTDDSKVKEEGKVEAQVNGSHLKKAHLKTEDGIFGLTELGKSLPTWEKLVFFLVGFLGLQILGSIISQIVAFSLLGSINPDNVEAYNKSVGVANSIVMFITYLFISIFFLCFILFDKRNTYKRVFKGFKSLKAIGYGLIGFALLFAMQELISLLYSAIPPIKAILTNNNNQESLNATTTASPISAVLMFFPTVLFAPFCEELTYRVGLCDMISKKNNWLGIILSCVIFGLIHFDITPLFESFIASASDIEQANMYLTEFYNELLNLPIYILSGLILVLTYRSKGEIASSMTSHLCNNLFSYILTLVSASLPASEIVTTFINL